MGLLFCFQLITKTNQSVHLISKSIEVLLLYKTEQCKLTNALKKKKEKKIYERHCTLLFFFFFLIFACCCVHLWMYASNCARYSHRIFSSVLNFLIFYEILPADGFWTVYVHCNFYEHKLNHSSLKQIQISIPVCIEASNLRWTLTMLLLPKCLFVCWSPRADLLLK